MKSIELLSTGIRLLGIYTFLYAIRVGVYQYQAILQFRSSSQDDMTMFIYLSIAQFLSLLVGSVLMFKFPVTVSNWILPKTRDDEPTFNGSSQDIEISLFIIMGVYILSWAIPDLLNNAIWFFHAKNSGSLDSGGATEYVINELITVIELSVGLFLCLQAKGISHVIRRLRETGAK